MLVAATATPAETTAAPTRNGSPPAKNAQVTLSISSCKRGLSEYGSTPSWRAVSSFALSNPAAFFAALPIPLPISAAVGGALSPLVLSLTLLNPVETDEPILLKK